MPLYCVIGSANLVILLIFATNAVKYICNSMANNLAERGLRGVKSHMKISGQFESEAAADNHALIRTYIETCRRNRINEIDALERLCAGNPYSVAEVFSSSSPP